MHALVERCKDTLPDDLPEEYKGFASGDLCNILRCCRSRPREQYPV